MRNVMDLRKERRMMTAYGCLIILKALYLWAPTPSVADLVSRKLWEAVQKRPNRLHVFICDIVQASLRNKSYV